MRLVAYALRALRDRKRDVGNPAIRGAALDWARSKLRRWADKEGYEGSLPLDTAPSVEAVLGGAAGLAAVLEQTDNPSPPGTPTTVRSGRGAGSPAVSPSHAGGGAARASGAGATAQPAAPAFSADFSFQAPGAAAEAEALAKEEARSWSVARLRAVLTGQTGFSVPTGPLCATSAAAAVAAGRAHESKAVAAEAAALGATAALAAEQEGWGAAGGDDVGDSVSAFDEPADHAHHDREAAAPSLRAATHAAAPAAPEPAPRRAPQATAQTLPLSPAPAPAPAPGASGHRSGAAHVMAAMPRPAQHAAPPTPPASPAGPFERRAGAPAAGSPSSAQRASPGRRAGLHALSRPISLRLRLPGGWRDAEVRVAAVDASGSRPLIAAAAAEVSAALRAAEAGDPAAADAVRSLSVCWRVGSAGMPPLRLPGEREDPAGRAAVGAPVHGHACVAHLLPVATGPGAFELRLAPRHLSGARAMGGAPRVPVEGAGVAQWAASLASAMRSAGVS